MAPAVPVVQFRLSLRSADRRRYEWVCPGSAACLAALDELMPDGVRWTHPGGGPTLWLELPRSVDYAALEAHLARRGIHVSNASAAYIDEPHLHGFRIAYAYFPEDQLRSALTILGDAIRALMR